VTASRGFGRALDRITLYLPIILMALLALGTYWLARNTPSFTPAFGKRPMVHEADYFLRGFSVKNFDPAGRLKSEITGAEARHFADTDTTEIEQPRIRSFNEQGALTVATARRAISNGDGSQVQLIGSAVVTREGPNARSEPQPRLEIRGEFLHVFLDKERVRSHLPVTLLRGPDQLQGDSLEYDNLERVLELRGRVRGTLQAQAAARP
jgi:lipopolysaccharide export system protein LptC